MDSNTIKLPVDFENRMKKLQGFDFERYKDAIENGEPAKALHINELKITEEIFEQAADFPVEKIEFIHNGFYFSHEHIGKTPLHHAGAFYVQEPSAMCPVEMVNIKSDWKVLDMCASPGGKSTQIANKLGENGVLVSNEIVPSRCKNLVGNFERMGIKNAIITNMDSETIGGMYKNVFDMVLVDAPCSGEGMFRKSESAIADWSIENVNLCANRQAEILENLADTVKPGGYLLYSTCTFSPEENEMNVDKFLKSHPEYKLINAPDKIIENTADGIRYEGCSTENIAYTRRFYPYISNGEGQFMALLQKDMINCDESLYAEEYFYKDGCKDLSKSEMMLASKFLDEVLKLNDSKKLNIKKYNNNIIILNNDMPVPAKKVFSCGVKLGEIVKNRIVPHHQFFMAYADKFRNQINLDIKDEKTAQYICGMGFEYPDSENGWAVVLINNCSVGGAKIVNGYVKNHYPKGLRN